MICKKYSKGVQVQYIWKFRPKIFHLRMWWKFVDKFSRARRTRIWTQFYHNYNNKRNFTSDFIMEIIEKNKYLNLLKDAGLLWWKGIEMTLNTHIHTCTHTHTHTHTHQGGPWEGWCTQLGGVFPGRPRQGTLQQEDLKHLPTVHVHPLPSLPLHVIVLHQHLKHTQTQTLHSTLLHLKHTPPTPGIHNNT